MLSDIGFLLKIINENAKRHANNIFKPIELTGTQVRVLKYLRERKGQLTTQKDCQDYLQVSHPTMVGIVQRLELKGFIECAFDEKNRRKKYIYLTQKDEENYQQMKHSKEVFEELLIRGFSKEETETLRELLLKVYDNVKYDREDGDNIC